MHAYHCVPYNSDCEPHDYVTLCGVNVSQMQNATWDHPKDFIDNIYYNQFNDAVCLECKSHEDLPLYLLSDIDIVYAFAAHRI